MVVCLFALFDAQHGRRKIYSQFPSQGEGCLRLAGFETELDNRAEVGINGLQDLGRHETLLRFALLGCGTACNFF